MQNVTKKQTAWLKEIKLTTKRKQTTHNIMDNAVFSIQKWPSHITPQKKIMYVTYVLFSFFSQILGYQN